MIKRYSRGLLILLLPVLLMGIINEAVRAKTKKTQQLKTGVTAINSAEKLPNKCTWVCHNNTTYCKVHHVKYLKPFYSITDVFYFGVIGILASTGNYGTANILFLVVLFPITILYFIIKSIEIRKEIRNISRNEI